MKTVKDAKLHKKLEVLQLRMEGYKNAEIARITKYSKSRVSALVCIYVHEGIAYFKQENRIGGNRRNLSNEEERALLNEFKESAAKGNIITVQDIKAAYARKGRSYHWWKPNILCITPTWLAKTHAAQQASEQGK